MSSPWLSASDAQHSTSDDNAWATTAASSSQHIRSRKSSFQTPSRPDGVDDPWSDRQPSASTGHLRARKSFLTPSRAEVVDRHPLRSPSPGQAGARPEATRRPSAVAAEWKAISNGLAGLFGASFTSTEYSWPPDPSSPTSQPHVDDGANKGRVESTLGKLENWFGLQPPPSQRAQSASASASTSTPAANEREPGDGQVRVLIHPVSPADTLASLALHYGADIQVLRKANRLWPGDPVQIRKSIYVPVDSCKHRPPNASIRLMHTKQGAVDPTLAFVPKEDDDLLTGTPLEELVPGLPGGADPVASFMPETNKAYSQDAFATSLSRTGSVKSLTPALRALNQANSSSAGAGAGAGRRGGSSIAASATSGGFVPPQQPLHVAKVPADQLRFFPTDAPPTAGKSGIDDLLSTTPNGAERPTLSRAVSSSTSAMDDEEEWKPNTWHFGRPATNTNSNTEPEGYRGWNDAPPPPNAVVARAYTQPRQSHHRLLNDLAAGLPANPGAASKWARPIQFGDSLPSNSTTATAPKERKGGLGRLLDDTIRGRISVERALGNAFETTSRQLAPPPRPSAASGPPPASRPPPPAASQSSGLQDAPIATKVDGGVMDRGGSTVARRNRTDWTKSKDD